MYSSPKFTSAVEAWPVLSLLHLVSTTLTLPLSDGLEQISDIISLHL